jgi:alkyl hydroperoxide reductase subunit F
VLALLWTGGHPSKEAQALLEQIRDIDGDFEFETYYSLSCHNCPDVVQALNLMSVLNPRIKHTAIDGGTFQNEITDRNVMGVPAVSERSGVWSGPYDADGNRRQSGYRCGKTRRKS